MLDICDGEDFWEWSWLEIRLNALCWSTIPQKQFIIISSSLLPYSCPCLVNMFVLLPNLFSLGFQNNLIVTKSVYHVGSASKFIFIGIQKYFNSNKINMSITITLQLLLWSSKSLLPANKQNKNQMSSYNIFPFCFLIGAN